MSSNKGPKALVVVVFLIAALASSLIVSIGCGTSMNASRSDQIERTRNQFKTRAEQELKAVSDEYANVEEASKKVSFKVRTPQKNHGHSISGIYVQRGVPREEKEVTILFTNGDYINEKHSPEPINYQATVDTFKQLNEQAETPQQPLPKRVVINGFEGTGLDAGVNEIEGQQEARPAVVSWSDDKGITYEIYSYDMTVDELVVMAQSMY